jgi:1,4-alpha-glucan branching enzyme
MPYTLSNKEVEKIVQSRHHDPFSVLGPHIIGTARKKSLVIRAFIPNTSKAYVMKSTSKHKYPMHKIRSTDLFEAIFPSQTTSFTYQLYVVKNGNASKSYDPYAFPPAMISDYDRYLFGQGTHYRIFDKLGAHVMRINRVSGVHFAVWAPNAVRVSVVGDFNEWDGRCHPMQLLGSSGIWLNTK